MPSTNTERCAEPVTAGGRFEDFYRAQWPGAVRLAALLTQSSAAAEDLAQEAFARLYPKWEDAEQPAAYLRASVVNACRSWHARSRRERLKLPLLLDVAVADLAADHLADAVAA